MTFVSLIGYEVFLKIEQAKLWLLASTSRDEKVKPSKDHGKKFQSKLAISFRVIVHSNSLFTTLL